MPSCETRKNTERMTTRLQLGDVQIDVVQKDIKNMHLSVHPPHGRVTIAAPLRMKADAIRVFAISKLRWIKQQREKQQAQPRESPRQHVERESHSVWGRRRLMKVIEEDRPPRVEVSACLIKLHIRPGASLQKRRQVMEQWQRSQVREELAELLPKWQRILRVQAGKVFVQRMRTRWGSCNHRTGTVRFNTDLARKPRECLEYVVAHELAHLHESTHNARFVALLDQHLPKWRTLRETLNQLPLERSDS